MKKNTKTKKDKQDNRQNPQGILDKFKQPTTKKENTGSDTLSFSPVVARKYSR